MEWLNTPWGLVVCCVLFVVVFACIVILFYKNKIKQEDIEKIGEYIDQIDDGDGVVAKLAAYAKIAVRAVEQLVKAGVIPKENETRKLAAEAYIYQFADADGIEIDTDEDEVIDTLIENEVYELKNE